jgi:hypothetical protein
VKVSAPAKRAFPVFIFRGAVGDGHPELVLALLAFIIPRIAFEDVLACAEGSPGRGFHDFGAKAGRARYQPV